MYGFKHYVSGNQSDAEIIGLYLNNPKMTVSEIARDTGKSEAVVYRILHANDVSPNRLRAGHQKVHNLASLGWGISEIAQLTGYTPRNVRYILAKSINEGQNDKRG